MEKGITYFRIPETKIENYKQYGDSVKRCGLTGDELDNNFFVLRGLDVKDGEVIDGAIVLHRMNGQDIRIEGDFEHDVDLSGTTYDSENGILTIVVNGEPSVILDGFSTCDKNYVYGSILEIDERLDEIDEEINELSGTTNAVKLDLLELSGNTERDISNITSQVNSNTSGITANRCEIANIKETLAESAETITNKLSEIDSRLDVNEDGIESLGEYASNLNEKVDSLDSEVECVKSKMVRADDLPELIKWDQSLNGNVLIGNLKVAGYTYQIFIPKYISDIKTKTEKWIEISDDDAGTGKVVNFLGIKNPEIFVN